MNGLPRLSCDRTGLRIHLQMEATSIETAERLLNLGLEQLPPQQQALLRLLYLDECRAPKQVMRARYSISADSYQSIHESALNALKTWLCVHGIKSLSDVL